MFSAETLSWILGARRFTSIARICDSRTPVTVTSCSSSACLAPASGPALPSDALADVAAASNAMDMAIDRGRLRYTFDTAFPSRLLSHPLAIAWIAHGKNAQISSTIRLHAPSIAAAKNGVVETLDCPSQ